LSSVGKLPVTKTARYFINRHPDDKTRFIWIVLHGYGLHPGYFLRKFDVLDSAVHTVVAPEGLSRFYQDGVTGRVGASWMTKEEREDDIEDNLNYLDKLYSHLRKSCPPDVKLVVLGFSQGRHTTARWLTRRRPEGAHRCIVGASDLPEDCLGAESCETLNKLHPTLFIGDSDPYISPERYERLKQLLDTSKLAYSIIPYSGDHRVYSDVLSDFVDKSL
jgi:predicted esterase